MSDFHVDRARLLNSRTRPAQAGFAFVGDLCGGRQFLAVAKIQRLQEVLRFLAPSSGVGVDVGPTGARAVTPRDEIAQAPMASPADGPARRRERPVGDRAREPHVALIDEFCADARNGDERVGLIALSGNSLHIAPFVCGPQPWILPPFSFQRFSFESLPTPDYAQGLATMLS